MKLDIILSGVGGQGIVSIAATIGMAALDAGLFLKQSEVHGMSQRGGEVSSHLRISDSEIASDIIPEGKTDIIISVEPMESLRYMNMLKSDGWLITNTKPFVNIPNYPESKSIIKEIKGINNHIALDADEIAKAAGSVKAANMVLLGAALQTAHQFAIFEKIKPSLEKAIEKLFGSKSAEVVEMNIKAFRAGLAYN